MWHDVHTKFQEDWYRRSSNITVLPQQFERLLMLVLLKEGIYDVRR
jgi:hypothetical protein